MPEARDMEGMIEEFLVRQARYRREQTGEPVDQALDAVLATRAGQEMQSLLGKPPRMSSDGRITRSRRRES